MMISTEYFLFVVFESVAYFRQLLFVIFWHKRDLHYIYRFKKSRRGVYGKINLATVFITRYRTWKNAKVFTYKLDFIIHTSNKPFKFFKAQNHLNDSSYHYSVFFLFKSLNSPRTHNISELKFVLINSLNEKFIMNFGKTFKWNGGTFRCCYSGQKRGKSRFM